MCQSDLPSIAEIVTFDIDYDIIVLINKKVFRVGT